MRKIRLSALGIEFDAPDNLHYHDDGLVSSVIGHSYRLHKKYGAKPQDTLYRRILDSKFIPNFLLMKLRGRCFCVFPGKSEKDRNYTLEDAVNDGKEVNIHTYVRDDLCKETIIKTKGHEETNALLKINKLDLLKEALKKDGIQSSDLDKLGEEVICDIGGIYATVRRSLESEEEQSFNLEYAGGEIFEEALKWFREHMIDNSLYFTKA
jgi:hypothetical protein